ncbi:MAG: hypothetical protein M1814_000414 [Vezdaea aestivalis]|nr:MAG: hypothetical protein M1814_000414 [Vezdaea aestivalis]
MRRQSATTTATLRNQLQLESRSLICPTISHRSKTTRQGGVTSLLESEAASPPFVYKPRHYEPDSFDFERVFRLATSNVPVPGKQPKSCSGTTKHGRGFKLQHSGQTRLLARNVTAPQDPITADIIKRMNVASKNLDSKALRSLWSEARNLSWSPRESDASVASVYTGVPEWVCLNFIHAFGKVGEGEGLMVFTYLFKELREHGLLPSPRSFNAAIVQCKYDRRSDEAYAIWEALCKSSIPDVRNWTAWIAVLANTDQPEAAARQLLVMGRLWMDAIDIERDLQQHYSWQHEYQKFIAGFRAQGDKWMQEFKHVPHDRYKHLNDTQSGICKPNEHTISVAISAVYKGTQHPETKVRFAEAIITWTRKLGIPVIADTMIFLIQIFMQAHRAASAQEMLNQLKATGYVPGVIFYTQLLQSLFQSVSENKGPTSQDRRLGIEQTMQFTQGVLMEMEEHGVEPSQISYSTIINGLMRIPNSDVAIDRMLEYMREKGVVVSKHVHTILIQAILRDAISTKVPRKLLLSRLLSSVRQMEREKTGVDGNIGCVLVAAFAKLDDIDGLREWMRKGDGRDGWTVTPGARRAAVSAMQRAGLWQDAERYAS